MSRRRHPSAHADRTKKKYAEILRRMYGNRTPSVVPSLYEELPESMRAMLRAALKAYWYGRGDEARGILLAAKILPGRTIKRSRVWPTLEEADLFEKIGAQTEPLSAWLVTKLALRLGFRAEGLLGFTRDQANYAVRYGRVVIMEKGDVERTLPTSQIKGTLQGLLETPAMQPHAEVDRGADQKWSTLGQVLASPGSSFETQRHLLARYLHKVASAAGLDTKIWHPHTLRHVFAERMLDRGANVSEIQAALGHASVETTMGYLHPRPEAFGSKMRGD